MHLKILQNIYIYIYIYIQETAEVTGDLIDIKITGKIIKVSITSPQNSLGTVANGTEYFGLDREIPTNLYIYIYIYTYIYISQLVSAMAVLKVYGF